MDIRMPPCPDRVEATRLRRRRVCARVKVLVPATCDSDEDVVEAMRAGACGLCGHGHRARRTLGCDLGGGGR
jgi:DNA-binding NarL/FixJ family response regulator